MQHFLMMDLLRAFYWFDEALQLGLRKQGWSDVTRSQSLILANIAFGVRRAADLARNVGVTRQAVSQMLAEMERKELIRFKPDPSDGRAQIVSFSPSSRKLRDDAMNTLAAVEAHLARQIGSERLAQLVEALGQDWGPAAEVIEKAELV